MKLAEAVEMGLTEYVGPSYSVYHYNDQIYKVIRFKSTAPRVGPVRKRGEEKPEDGNKPIDLHSSISRAKRRILELALCNEWDYFCTFTLDPKYDRFDLKKWYGNFAQFIRDQRKKHGVEIRFLLVPETHKDGAWHIHGLIQDAPPLVSFADRLSRGENVPIHLARDGFKSWPDYERRFGFNSFGPIKNPVACSFYITKYVSKAIDEGVLNSGAHRYYASLGLNRANLHGQVYGDCGYLDQFLHNHYDFCDTGMTSVKDGCDWTFAMDYMEVQDMLEPLDLAEPPEDDRAMFEAFFDFIQEKMEGFSVKKYIRLTALLLALVTVFTLPASAEDWNNVTSYNVLDYCTIEDSGTNSYSLSNGNYPALPLPAYTVVRGVDLLVYSNTSNLNMQINSGSSTNWYEMERQSLGNGIIRFYNFSLPGYRHEELNFYLTYDSGSYVEFLRVDLYQAKAFHFNDIGQCKKDGFNYAMSSPYSYVEIPNSGDNLLSFYTTNWKKYDYIDYCILVDSSWGFGSVSAEFNYIALPVDVSVVENVDNYEDTNSDGFSFVPVERFFVTLRVDLRGIDRSIAAIPYVHVTCEGAPITLYSCVGYVVPDSIDPWVYFFNELETSFSEDFAVLQARMDAIGEELAAMHTNMKTYISNLQTALVDRLNALQTAVVSELGRLQLSMEAGFEAVGDLLYDLVHPDTDKSEEFQETVESQGQEIQDANDTMEEVTKPDVDEIGSDIDDVVNQGDPTAVGNVLVVVLEDEILGAVILMSLAFAICGYVLYGKR